MTKWNFCHEDLIPNKSSCSVLKRSWSHNQLAKTKMTLRIKQFLYFIVILATPEEKKQYQYWGVIRPNRRTHWNSESWFHLSVEGSKGFNITKTELLFLCLFTTCIDTDHMDIFRSPLVIISFKINEYLI